MGEVGIHGGTAGREFIIIVKPNAFSDHLLDDKFRTDREVACNLLSLYIINFDSITPEHHEIQIFLERRPYVLPGDDGFGQRATDLLKRSGWPTEQK